MKPICVISCPIDTFSGYGARSRDFVNSLIQLRGEEWHIKILPQRWGDCPWNYLSKDDPLRQRFINKVEQKPDVWIQITIPEEFQPLGNNNIGVTAGIESTLYHANWIEGMNRMHVTLISSEHSKKAALYTSYDKLNKQTNQKEGELKVEKPIEVLFEGLDLDTYHKIQNPKSEILKDVSEEFCFLFTGHWLTGDFGEDRKNVPKMIKTFLETFTTPSKKKPALILKTNQVNYSLIDRENIIKLINDLRNKYATSNSPNIYLLHGEMTNEEMNLLNNDPKIKAFVSFTKGEGFGRPLIEAAITGKPIITTNWSGHIDFLHPEYNILIGGELKNIHESAANKWLMKESQWFDINTDVASRALKDVYKHYKKYLEKSRKQTQYIKNNFSLNKMTELLNKYLPIVEAAPQMQQLKLPNLKKEKTPERVKPNLPKLKKIEA